MSPEVIFRGSLAVVSALLALIRLYYGWRTRQAVDRIAFKRANPRLVALVWMFGLVAASASVLYSLFPRWMAWATVPLAIGMRWAGVAAGLVTVLLFFWVHRALGPSWGMPGVIKERQAMVSGGPYRWVRHPMYATLFVWALAFFLLSANWFIGLAWLGLGAAAAATIDDEEAALIEKFGEAYQAYMRETGRLLPRWKREESSEG